MEILMALASIVLFFVVFFGGFYMQVNLIYDDYKFWPPGICGIILITIMQLVALFITTLIVVHAGGLVKGA